MLARDGSSRAVRSSNLELARIFAMLTIVAHHYVVNSGVVEVISQTGWDPRCLFLQLWGMWGKTAINVFVLITGYFMCEKAFRWRRLAKVVLQVTFWKTVLLPLFLFAGLPSSEGVQALLSVFFLPFFSVNNGFTASFIVFYLAIPLLKHFIDLADKRMHASAIALLLAVDTVSFTFFNNLAAFTEVSWYCALFLIAAWLRRYPPLFIEDFRICRSLFFCSVILAIASVLAMDAFCAITGTSAFFSGLYFVNQSGRALALLVGLTCFLFFRVLPMGHSRFVNTVASTTFGVLLIHANSNAMRKLLWKDLLNVPAAYLLPLPLLVAHAFACVLGVFVVSSALDYLRLRFAEPRYMAWYDANEGKIARVCTLAVQFPGRIVRRLDEHSSATVDQSTRD